MFYVYLLQSQRDRSYYIGYTKDLKGRLEEHNSGKTRSTKSKLPYDLIYFEAYKYKILARKREIELKKSASKKKQIIERLQLGPVV